MKTKTVTLTAPHTHAGQPHPAGTVLTLPASDAAWLIQQGVATRGTAPATDDTPTDTHAAERAPVADGNTTGDETP